MNDTEWEILVADAKSARPEQLLIRLQRWGIEFEMTERRRLLAFTPAEEILITDTTPVLADYPPLVQDFFKWLAPATRTGRPCSDEREIFAAYKAWRSATFRETYDTHRFHLQLSRDAGIPFNGEILGRGDAPSDAALEAISASAGLRPEGLRDVIFPTKKR